VQFTMEELSGPAYFSGRSLVCLRSSGTASSRGQHTQKFDSKTTRRRVYYSRLCACVPVFFQHAGVDRVSLIID
jgi:hypothetical protein